MKTQSRSLKTDFEIINIISRNQRQPCNADTIPRLDLRFWTEKRRGGGGGQQQTQPQRQDNRNRGNQGQNFNNNQINRRRNRDF